MKYTEEQLQKAALKHFAEFGAGGKRYCGGTAWSKVCGGMECMDCKLNKTNKPCWNLTPDEAGEILKEYLDMELKVGDRVRKIEGGFKGKVGTVIKDKEVFMGNFFWYVRFDNGEEWNCLGSCLQFIERKKDMDKEFTKADLKTGDVTVNREGKTYRVFKNMEGLEDCFAGEKGHNEFRFYNNDLTGKNFKENDIMQVWRPSGTCGLRSEHLLPNSKFMKLIWQRKEPNPVQEMTLADVCKELGREIKIIKE